MAFCGHINVGECMHCHSKTCLDCKRRQPTRISYKTIGSLVCLHCDGLRLAKLQLTANERDERDERVCQLCLQPMSVDFDKEPTAFCHSCIYEVADRLAADLEDTERRRANTQKWLAAAAAENAQQESGIERAVATAMGLPPPTRSADDTAAIRAAVDRVRRGRNIPAMELPPPDDEPLGGDPRSQLPAMPGLPEDRLYTGIFRGGFDDDDSE